MLDDVGRLEGENLEDAGKDFLIARGAGAEGEAVTEGEDDGVGFIGFGGVDDGRGPALGCVTGGEGVEPLSSRNSRARSSILLVETPGTT